LKKNKIIELYNTRLDKYGNDPKSVGWKNLESQYLRFFELTENLKINEHSEILDLGCGYGALIDFFKINKIKIKEENYCGIDFSNNMIEVARGKYSKATFFCSDFYKVSLKKVDYTFCSGALNIKINNENIYQNLEKFISTFLPNTKIALSFNLIHDIVDYKDKNLNYYNLPKVINLISSFSRKFHLKNSSKLYETSLTIYKS